MTKQIYVYLRNAPAKIKRRLLDRKLKKAARDLYAEYTTNCELTAFSELELNDTLEEGFDNGK